ncbi:MAG: hypothetical protein QNL61_11925 [Crocinitomicaceae bacterium]
MKKYIYLFVLFATVNSSVAQKVNLNLKNAVVIGQLDNTEDRYSLEINLTELLTSRGVKTIPSLNIMKIGSDSQLLASNSMTQVLKAKGIDTYILVSVRGYDRKFKPTTSIDNLFKSLELGSLFNLYQTDIVSVSFEFKFYRNGEFITSDIVKCANVSDRETVLKRFRIKVGKRISSKWL